MTQYYYQDDLFIIEKMMIWDEEWYFLCEYKIEDSLIKKGYTIRASTIHDDVIAAMTVHKIFLKYKERGIE